MGLQYNPPSFLKPTEYNLDNIFNAYIQARNARTQNELGQQQVQIGQQQIDQRQQDQSLQPVKLSMELGQNTLPQDHPLYGAVNSWLQNKNQSTDLQKRLTESEITKNLGANNPKTYNYEQAVYLANPGADPKEKQAMLNQFKAIYPNGKIPESYVNQLATTGRSMGMKDEPTPEESAAIRRASLRATNPLPLSMIPTRGPRARLIGQALLEDPNYSPNLGEGQLSGAKALGSKGAPIIANTQTLQSSLDILDDLNKSIPRESLQTINKYGLAIAAEMGDRSANKLYQQSRVVSDLFQSNFGQGSDIKLALAQALSDPKQTTNQLSDSISLVRADMKNRISAYQGSQGTARPEFSGGQSNNGAWTPEKESRYQELLKKKQAGEF